MTYATYTTRSAEGIPVTVEANLDFDTADTDADWMLWTFVPLNSRNEEGGCSEEELRTLETIKREILQRTELGFGTVYAGMRLLEGWAELYFYAVHGKGAEKQFRDVFRSHGYSRIEFGTNRDTHHDFYHESIAPDAHQYQQSKSLQIIAELMAAGDDLSNIRPVEHYLFFQTRTAMQRVAERLSESGRLETGLKEEGEYPYGLMIELEHACTPEAVSEAAAPLIDAALEAHGIYLGWSTALTE